MDIFGTKKNKSREKAMIILVLCFHIEDIIYSDSCSKMKDDFKKAIMDEFEKKDLGLIHCFLGMEVRQLEDGIFICQTKYIHDTLKTYSIDKCKLIPTLIAHGEKQCHHIISFVTTRVLFSWLRTLFIMADPNTLI